MIQVSISEEVSNACPDLQVLVIACQVRNTEPDERLWQEIEAEEAAVRATVKLEQINKWLPIQATRQAYKRLGKDPNRYRPSAEALRRRILRELPLYKVDTLVDLINLVSIRSGYSIGGFDADKIEGGKLVLGVGREGELYHGIGRGELNIAGLPVYRDAIGGIGTPTSDEERTKIGLDTTSLLMILNGYSGLDGLIDAGKYAAGLLSKYVSATNIEMELVSAGKRTEIVL
ncbi:phenylalanine--tRNA ligase beta subunit-related protein [uncultured Parabacteroides sp.]|uniref:B3/B4 domain-containing protein n=1 Tax=uncultured Parabacteroides sp. TaxID=512312 RepID=UPI0025F1E81C|nr:phenylalanine--tRNA ligase beta subunit-related protein [uncultured Parabacteroides sp.]